MKNKLIIQGNKEKAQLDNEKTQNNKAFYQFFNEKLTLSSNNAQKHFE